MKLTKLMRNAALVFGVALAVPVHAVKITPDGVQITPASEPRGHVEVVVSDDIVYFLGLSVEPAYLLEPNNVEIFACTDLVRDPATGELLDCRSINEADNVRGDPSTHPEDKVRVKARIDALDKEGEDAKVVSRAKLGKLKVVNPTEGHYATKTFLPYPPGPIAVRISGTINGVETDLRTACTIGEPHTQRRTVAMKSTHFLIVAGLVAVTTSAYRSADAAQFAPGIEKRYADGQIVVYYNNSFGATCKAQEGGCLIGVLPYTDVEYDAEGNVIN
ncbi:MAG: hypothetical protein ACREXY_28325, partial [Gammaproteobacteria bacterium]